MNIPEVSNEVKQSLRSESVTTAQSMEALARDMSGKNRSDAVQGLSGTDKNKEQEQHFSKEELNQFIEESQKELERNNVNLKFNILEEADTIQVEVVDAEGKVIRKIPGDDLLKLTESLKNLERGFLDMTS